MSDITLYKIVSVSCEIKKALIEGMGEITEEMSAQLLEIEKQLPSKVDGYKYVIEDLQSEAELWKKRAETFNKVAESFSDYSQKMKDSILAACVAMEVTELKGNEFTWKVIASKPRVIIENEDIIPSGHKEVVQIIKTRKDSILEDLKQGLEVPGAHLEQSNHVRVYPNVKKE